MEKTVSYLSVDPQNIHILPAGIVLKQRYQIQNLLGQGGFGITYLGWDHLLQTPVAIKEFFPQSIVNRDCSRSLEVRCNTQNMVPGFHSSKQRFLREAQALEKFRDIPAIVGILDYFEENNTAYIVMEYVSGMNLKEYVDRKGGRLTVEETLKLLEPVFLALIHVHKSGLVHRDISPDNIMLSPQEGAKLLDFGAVRSVENPGVDKPLTHSTEAILKHGFAPIEQYNTRGSLGPWTDEYALCATIYYCLTGTTPEPVTLRLTESLKIDWAGISGLDENSCRALEKGMSIQPHDRFSNVEELYRALYLGATVKAPVQSGASLGKNLKIALVSLIAALLVLALGSWMLVDAFGGRNTDSDDSSKGGGGREPSVSGPEITPPENPSDMLPEPPESSPSKPSEETVPDQDWIENVMVEEPLNVILNTNPDVNDISDYEECRGKVGTVTFLDNLDGMPETVYHLGEGGTDRVVGWTQWNGGYMDIYIAAEGGINASKACKNLFAGCVALRSIDFGGAFHTDGCDNMKWMFYKCYQLRSLDVSGFDTSRVTMMQAMFRECGGLTELDVSTFDTSKVMNMAQMFSTCTSIEYLDLSNFDTSRVENMSQMFSACRSLRSVDVSSFDTSRVYNMEGVFAWCNNLEDMTLAWDVSGVTNYAMFMADGKTINGKPWLQYFQN